MHRLVAIAVSVLPFFAHSLETPNYRNKNLPVESRVGDLVKRLTIEEKVNLVHGDNDFSTMANERLGIPAIHMTDGPLGVRGALGKQATAFPAGIAMAATFDRQLIGNVSTSIAREAGALGFDMLLAPCVNISRHPLGGRNFENFGEDPYLTGEMARSYVLGVQRQGIISNTKHLVLNDQDYNRKTLNVIGDERTMEEVYLPPFKAAIDADTWSIMTAYNKINGSYGSENSFLIDDLLRKRWGFKGFVVSDWWATHSTMPAARAGLDIEMPDDKFFGKDLLGAVGREELPVSVIDDKIRRTLSVMFRSGLFDRTMRPPMNVVGSPIHTLTAKRAADASIVLLKNDGRILPLADSVRSIAVIGEGGRHLRVGGKGSSMVNPIWVRSPLEVLRAAHPTIQFNYAIGTRMAGDFDSILSDNWTTDPVGAHGVIGQYFPTMDLSGDPAITRIDPNIDFDWEWNAPGAGLRQDRFSARWTGFYHANAPTSLALRSDDGARLWIDDHLVVDAWEGHMDRIDPVPMQLEAGHTYKIRLEYYQNGKNASVGLGYDEPKGHEADDAIALARTSDVAIVFAGLSRYYEGEELDRATFEMPAGQNELIAAVAAANPNTIVVLQGGNPVPMPWLAQVKGVLHAWYGGQQGSESIADALFGRINPSGKLPVTFPRRWEDSSAYGHFPADDGMPDQLTYGEGIYVGYRHFDRANVEPLFPFGFGLSYTTFRMSHLNVIMKDRSTAHPKAEVRVRVTNTGTRVGEEVVQVYVREASPAVDRPVRELKQFAKVHLRPGQTKEVRLQLDRSSFAYFDPNQHAWHVSAGTFSIDVGNSSRSLPLSSAVVLR